MKFAPTSRAGGFSLTELLIAVPCGIVAMLMLFALSNIAMNLMARNISTNLAHVFTRNPMERIRQDVFKTAMASNGASTLVQLTGALSSGTYPAVTGTGPAAGVYMEVYFAGPYQVANNCNGNSTSVQITVAPGGPAIRAGMNLAIPSYNIDVPINSVSTSGSTVTCTLSNPLVSASSSGLFLNLSNAISSYITLPTHYYVSTLVSGTQLIRQDAVQALSGTMTVIQYNVINAQPFTLPPGSTVGTQGSFLSVDLAGSNPDYSNRNFQSSNMAYPNIWIPVMGPLSANPVLSSTLY